MLDGYEYTDKVIKRLLLRFVRAFNLTKAWRKKKPKEIIDDFFEFYEDILGMTEDVYLDIAKHYYQPDNRSTKITKAWLKSVLNEYDPTAKYVFAHEVDRKRSRHTEAFIASATPEKETDLALRYWSNMVRQFADTITDRAHLLEMMDDGAKKVQWVTAEDERVCRTCRELDGNVFPIKEVPPKPHLGCRCWLKAIK